MSSSSNVVNYSLRQNKSIERSIVFDGARLVVDRLRLKDLVYVGFGSVWFSDFHQAHKQLDITTMLSIEADEVTHARAVYNAPYRTVEVVKGMSDEVVPELLTRDDLRERPWMVWLDYDTILEEGKLSELARLVVALPPDSLLITTFSASGGRYGRPAARPARLKQLFGSVSPESLDVDDYRDEALARLLAQTVQNFMLQKSLYYSRPGSYVPAFRLTYKDGTPMVTVGGFLPSLANRTEAVAMTTGVSWLGILDETIDTPPLTAKESLALQQALPIASAPLTRADVQAMGFDLEEGQVDSFQRHYLRYPTFSQLSN